jgi:hypothetical protein
MKYLSQATALQKLHSIKTEFAEQIHTGFEHKAKSCATCERQGACCLDEHFVNVHITRLEAVAIRERLNELSEDKRNEVYDRIDTTIERYGLSDSGDTFAQTYACPLFEKGTGCLVHAYGKPLPCIAHACYERKEDLPPGEFLAERENAVDDLNEKVYGKPAQWLPLPVAICKNRLQ